MLHRPIVAVALSIAGEDPVDVFSSYKGAIFGGEPLSGRLKSLMDSWGFEMFETTSLGDVAGATECHGIFVGATNRRANASITSGCSATLRNMSWGVSDFDSE